MKPIKLPAADDPGSYAAAKDRKIQISGRRSASPFDAAKRQVFLKWFAATCNVRLSARQAKVDNTTVYRARMNDAAFAEAWDRALDQGYARLEAKLLEMQFEAIENEPIDFDPAFQPPDDKLVSPDMAMQLLRHYQGATARGRRLVGAAAEAAGERLASDAEVRAALAKRLRAFGVRVTKEHFAPDEDET